MMLLKTGGETCPPVYLLPGQVVAVEIEGSGALVNQVVECSG
jgi:hypothetical protein